MIKQQKTQRFFAENREKLLLYLHIKVPLEQLNKFIQCTQ